MIGTFETQFGDVSQYRLGRGDEFVDDVTDGFDTENYFNLVRLSRSGGSLSGQRIYNLNPDRIAKWTNVPCGSGSFGGTSLVPMESEDNAARRAFNITNPGRPDILLPVFLAEMKDIPRMVRQAGDTVRWIRNGIKRPPNTVASQLNTAKKLAADNLAYQFGWEPLLGDLMKMAMFTENVEKRSKELSRLHSGNGLKRRITLDDRSESQTNTNEVPIWTSAGNWLALPPGTVTYKTEIRRWSTLRYQPTADSPLPDNDQAIRRMLLGLTLNSLASNLWEAIPWTWLVDYFSNLGDIVASTNNSAHVSVAACSTMTFRKETWSAKSHVFDFGFPGSAVTYSAYTGYLVQKSRKPGLPPFPLPEIGLPLLGGRQLSILGSLAVMRMGR